MFCEVVGVERGCWCEVIYGGFCWCEVGYGYLQGLNVQRLLWCDVCYGYLRVLTLKYRFVYVVLRINRY